VVAQSAPHGGLQVKVPVFSYEAEVNVFMNVKFLHVGVACCRSLLSLSYIHDRCRMRLSLSPITRGLETTAVAADQPTTPTTEPAEH